MRCPNETPPRHPPKPLMWIKSKEPQARRNNGLTVPSNAMQPSFLKFFMVQFRHPEFGRCPKSVETWGKRYQLYFPRPRLLQRCRLRPRRVGGWGWGGVGVGHAAGAVLGL